MAVLSYKIISKKKMMKTKMILCLLAMLPFLNGYSQNNMSKLTLKNCLDIALANNIPLKQSILQEDAAKINFNQARFNRLPDITAGAGYGINSGRSIDPFTNSYNNQKLSSSSANLSASIPVFRGFQIKNAIQQASFAYQASTMELKQEKDNLSLNIILSFLQVMNDEDVFKLTKEQMGVTEKQVDRLGVLNAEGAIAPSVLFDMKGQFASDKLSVINATRSLEISKLNLVQFMNIPYNKDIQIDRDGLDLTIAMYESTSENIFDTALQNLAMIKAADLRKKAAAKAIKIAASDFYPSLSVSGQLGTNYSSAARTLTATGNKDVATSDYVIVSGNNLPVITKQTNYNSHKIDFFNQYKNNLGTYIGLNLSIPIFASFRTKSNIKLARIEEKRNSYIADNTRIQLRQAIEQAYINMLAAYNKYQATQEQVEAYKESFRAAEIRFNLGALNSVEYLIVKNNLDRSGINLTIAQYEYLLRTKVLDFYQGKLK